MVAPLTYKRCSNKQARKRINKFMAYKRHDKDNNARTPAAYQRHDKDNNPVTG